MLGGYRRRGGGRPSPSAHSYVFDAGVFALFFAGDSSVKPYFDKASSGRASGFVSEVNLAEFYYKTGQRFDMETADARLGLVRTSQILSISTNEDAVVAAGKWKLKDSSLSLADCFALATLEANGEVLLTTDPELKRALKSRAVFFEV